MKWSPDVLDQIREAHDIVEWIGRDTVLKASSSGQYTGLCPFLDHNEKTPSFSVSSVKQVYHCFGCKKSGDLFTYLQEQKGMSFTDAVRYLAQQAGISLSAPKQESATKNSERLQIFDVNKKASQVFHETLMKTSADHPIHKYLSQRGYSKEIIKKFQLGYASKKGDLLSHFSDQEKKALKKVGLIGEKTTSQYEFFRHRLMFPIISPMNQVLGFGGRSLGSSLPKYINSRDSICFQKGHVFYGLNESASFIRKKGYVLVVEGYTDFLTLFQNGFQNVVATLGVALTSHHARLLKRYTDKVVLFFDGDQAGEQAAVRSLPILLQEGLRVHSVELEGMDPDECIRKKGIKFLTQLISKNHDLFLHLFLKQLESKHSVEKLDLVRKMHPILHGMKDQVLKEYYESSILDVFTASEKKSAQMILNEKPQFRKQFVSRNDTAQTVEKEEEPKKEEFVSKVSLEDISKPELYLLVLSLHSLKYLDYIAQNLEIQKVSDGGLRQIFEMIFQQYTENSEDFDKLFARVMLRVKPEGLLYVQNHPILINLDFNKGVELIKDCLARLSLNYENTRIKTLTMQLKLGQGDKNKYLKEIRDIKRKLLSMENSYEK